MEKFEDTKEVIRIRKSKKDRQRYGRDGLYLSLPVGHCIVCSSIYGL
jgi:hypothetical protein